MALFNMSLDAIYDIAAHQPKPWRIILRASRGTKSRKALEGELHEQGRGVVATGGLHIYEEDEFDDLPPEAMANVTVAPICQGWLRDALEDLEADAGSLSEGWSITIDRWQDFDGLDHIFVRVVDEGDFTIGTAHGHDDDESFMGQWVREQLDYWNWPENKKRLQKNRNG